MSSGEESCSSFTTLYIFTAVYLKCSDQDIATLLRPYTDTVKTLTTSSSVNLLVDEAPPAGCAMATVSDKCEVHLLLKVCFSIYLNSIHKSVNLGVICSAIYHWRKSASSFYLSGGMQYCSMNGPSPPPPPPDE